MEGTEGKGEDIVRRETGTAIRTGGKEEMRVGKERGKEGKNLSCQ